MPKSNASEEVQDSTSAHRDSESEDESEILEESHGGRWQKRREQVTQRDVPGIDAAYLAMDTEEGVEVVWNEVQISDKKSSKSQLEKISQVFDNLIQLDHPNIVKFHQYWTDAERERKHKRVVFITEYMSSGSLKQFLKKTKQNNKTLKAWKRWCRQILSALEYLHSCEPPIIHGNLTTDTIFIQHNGLIKIGSVAPDAIYSHVKTYKHEARNMHYAAPEYAGNDPMTTAVDIYSFGICALEMAALEIPGNGGESLMNDESVMKVLESVKDPLQKDFISKCLEKDRSKRPTARELLFHSVLFEVPSLKLLAAYQFIEFGSVIPEHVTEKTLYKAQAEYVLADKKNPDGTMLPLKAIEIFDKMYGKGQYSLDLEKFLEDVRNGVYPLTSFASVNRSPPPSHPRAVSPEGAKEPHENEAEAAIPPEGRRIVAFSCKIQDAKNEGSGKMTLTLRFEDKMNRQLTCEFVFGEETKTLVEELVHYCFIHPEDMPHVSLAIEQARTEYMCDQSAANRPPATTSPPLPPPPTPTQMVR